MRHCSLCFPKQKNAASWAKLQNTRPLKYHLSNPATAVDVVNMYINITKYAACIVHIGVDLVGPCYRSQHNLHTCMIAKYTLIELDE